MSWGLRLSLITVVAMYVVVASATQAGELLGIIELEVCDIKIARCIYSFHRKPVFQCPLARAYEVDTRV